MDKKKGTKIINSKDLLMVSLSNFYNVKSNINSIIPIITPTSNSKISLRLIDWFVTNYSKKNNTIIKRKDKDTIIHFNVYLSYRSQLKAYSKQLFDSFRRRDRITFYFDVDKSIETTIGQLNMFRWILQNDILDYIQTNLVDIENDMIKTQKDNQNKRDENLKIKEVQTENGIVYQKRKKRNQLSKSSVKNMNLHSGQRIINFD
jgi:hypothetical protein